MLEILKLLKDKNEAVSGLAATVLMIAFMLASASKFTANELFTAYSELASIALFFLGTLVVLFRMAAPLFESRPAKGIFDGATAGIVAGVIGGAIGYGSHQIDYHVCLDPEPFDSDHLLRIFYCVAFSVPIGAVLGGFLDIFHRPSEFKLHKKVGTYSLLCVGLIIGTTCSLFWLLPESKFGISVADLLTLATVFVVVHSAILTISDKTDPRSFFVQILFQISFILLVLLILNQIRIVDQFTILEIEKSQHTDCFSSLLDFQIESRLFEDKGSALNALTHRFTMLSITIIFSLQILIVLTHFLGLITSKYILGHRPD